MLFILDYIDSESCIGKVQSSISVRLHQFSFLFSNLKQKNSFLEYMRAIMINETIVNDV